MERRAFLIQASKWTATAIGFPVFLSACRETSQSPVAQPTAETRKPPLLAEAFQKELQRLGVSPSATEKKLWESMYLANPALRFDNLTQPQAERRVESTLDLMRKSENPYFRSAALDYDKFKNEGRALIAVGTNARINIEGGGLTSPRIDRDKIKAHTEFSGPDVLNRFNGFLLAILLTHEIEHQRNILKYDEEIANRTVDERLALHEATIQDRKYLIEEEARGSGIASQAFIYSVGLLEIPIDNRPSSLVSNAYQFILNGSTVDNPGWREHVRRTFVR